MRPQFQPLLRPLEWSEVAPLERVFEGDPKGSHYSIEHDPSLFIWPPASIVQHISVPLRSGGGIVLPMSTRTPCLRI